MRLTRRPLLIEADFQTRRAERRAAQGGPSDALRHAVERIRRGQLGNAEAFEIGEQLRHHDPHDAHKQFKERLGKDHPYTRASNHLENAIVRYQASHHTDDHTVNTLSPIRAASDYIVARNHAHGGEQIDTEQPTHVAQAARLAVNHLRPYHEIPTDVPARLDGRGAAFKAHWVGDHPRLVVEQIAKLLGGDHMPERSRSGSFSNVYHIGRRNARGQIASLHPHLPPAEREQHAQAFRDAITRLNVGHIRRHTSTAAQDGGRTHDFYIEHRNSQYVQPHQFTPQHANEMRRPPAPTRWYDDDAEDDF